MIDRGTKTLLVKRAVSTNRIHLERAEMAKKKYYKSSMVSEDRSSVANLPKNVIMSHWADPYAGSNYDIDDTINGIDHQIMADMKRKKSGSYPEKY